MSIAAAPIDPIGHSCPTEECTFEDALADSFDVARAEWPPVCVSRAVFVDHVYERLPDGCGLVDGLRMLRTGDLYLACACEVGDGRAIGIVEQLFIGRCAGELTRMGLDASAAQDVLQRVCEKLFVPVPGRPPRIHDYSGLGDLRGYVRTMVRREAISLQRERGRHVLTENPCGESTDGSLDPELICLQRLYLVAFEEAFTRAIAQLTREQRDVLRYHYVQRLSIDEIAAIQRNHRVTAARRLNRARRALADETRSILAERLDVSTSELRTVLPLIQAAVEPGMHRVLRGQ